MVMQDGHIRELKSLYSGLGYVTYFVHWRCFHTPYTYLETFLPKTGRILDLGCGYGLFSNLLGITSRDREVTGIDVCARKLKYAGRGVPQVKFIRSDAFDLAEFGRFDAIALVHILHHLRSYDAQEKLIGLCRGSLNPGGRIVILEVDTRPLPRFLFTALVDNVAYFGDRFYFRKSRAFKELLEKEGFQGTAIYPAWAGSPLSHVIISGKKAA